ncbi:MAG: DUF2177 family protein [Alphaproteobacteria bacterium]|nr:DUF2177 family protein [Alphaproteobacteria bacterium]
MRWIAAWFGAAVVFAGLDAVWLTSTNATLYRPVLAPVLLAGVRPAPAVLFYLVYLTGTVILAVGPALKAGRWSVAARQGALFGFFAYATYDLTNFATLAVWSTQITVLDLCWGTFLTAVGATAGYFAGHLASGAGRR